jgi:hypothetical protein
MPSGSRGAVRTKTESEKRLIFSGNQLWIGGDMALGSLETTDVPYRVKPVVSNVSSNPFMSKIIS